MRLVFHQSCWNIQEQDFGFGFGRSSKCPSVSGYLRSGAFPCLPSPPWRERDLWLPSTSAKVTGKSRSDEAKDPAFFANRRASILLANKRYNQPTILLWTRLMSDDARISRPATWMSSPATEIDSARLDQGEVHLCLMPLAQPATVIEELAPTLTPDEHERASRFHFDRDRHRFIVARGLLRRLLSRYVDAPAHSLRFACGPFGKPYLETIKDHGTLAFSLSHSGDWALAGVARGREIGVDLEQVRPMADYRDLSESNFAPAETEAILKLPKDRQIDGFFACWTRKEAYVKALGLGLSLDLSTFVVSIEPSERMEIIPANLQTNAHHMWGMQPLRGYWAAVAVEVQNEPAMFPKISRVPHSALAT